MKNCKKLITLFLALLLFVSSVGAVALASDVVDCDDIPYPIAHIEIDFADIMSDIMSRNDLSEEEFLSLVYDGQLLIEIAVTDILADMGIERDELSRQSLPMRVTARNLPFMVRVNTVVGSVTIDFTFCANAMQVWVIHSAIFSTFWTTNTAIYSRVEHSSARITGWHFWNSDLTFTFSGNVNVQLASGANAGQWVNRQGNTTGFRFF